MPGKTDFTPEEWKKIVAAAPMVGLAVTCASPNGPWGVMKEMLSMGMAMAEMLQKGSSNPLIADLAADLKARQTKPERWTRATRNWTPVHAVTLNPTGVSEVTNP